jgi:signal transduction histidine kinase
MERLRTLLRAHALDALIVGIAATSALRLWAEGPAVRGPAIVLALLSVLPLLGRRLLPLMAPLSALAALLGLSLLVPGAAWEQLQLFLGALLCLWVIGSENERPWAIAGLVAGLAVALATVATDAGHRGVGDYAFAVAITTAAWSGGLVLGTHARSAAAAQRRAEELAAEEEQRAREAVAQERARIAREVHDVIAHTVSVMVVQAGAAEQVLDGENEAARAALAAIRQSGKGALVELRRLLGLLRDTDDGGMAPQAGLDRLDDLVAEARALGLRVEVTESGSRRILPPGLDQAAYRIVQEALTNTIKHAGTWRASVSVTWGPAALELCVADEGAGSGVRVPDGAADGGHGLVGMRERAALYGGSLDAGPRPGGGFAVRARLPL